MRLLATSSNPLFFVMQNQRRIEHVIKTTGIIQLGIPGDALKRSLWEKKYSDNAAKMIDWVLRLPAGQQEL